MMPSIEGDDLRLYVPAPQGSLSLPARKALFDESAALQGCPQAIPSRHQRFRQKPRIFALVTRKPFSGQRHLGRQCARRKLLPELLDGAIPLDPLSDLFNLLIAQ